MAGRPRGSAFQLALRLTSQRVAEDGHVFTVTGDELVASLFWTVLSFHHSLQVRLC